MIEVNLKFSKELVYDEVAKITSYTGSKAQEDPTAYERIFTKDEDRAVLETFFKESKELVIQRLRRDIFEEGELDEIFYIVLWLSESFDSALVDSLQRSLFSFLVTNIVSKWYLFCNKSEANFYSELAKQCLDDAIIKILHKKKPTRPTY